MLFYEHVIAFFIFLSIAMITSFFANSIGFYHLPEESKTNKPQVKGSQVIGGFAVMMAVEIFAIPLIYYSWIFFKEGQIPDFSTHKLNVYQQGWLNILAILTTAIALLIYCLLLGKSTMRDVWGKGVLNVNGEFLINLLIGALTWFVVYPLVTAVGQLIALSLSIFYIGPHTDQIAVKHLKNIIEDPWLFPLTVVEIITLVPLIEELIFRGFLQTWLKSKLGVTKAILATSVIFAFFHFSFGQGIDNIELVASLFVLSCFLGFIRERQQSLWASIGLHSIFNSVSIFFLSKIANLF